MCHVYKFIVHLILIGIAFWSIDVYLPDFIMSRFDVTGLDTAFSITPSSWFGYGVVAVIFSLVNTILKPVLKLLTFPLRLLTFGLFSFVLNAFLLWVVQLILEIISVGVTMGVEGLWTYVVVGVIMAMITLIIP